MALLWIVCFPLIFFFSLKPHLTSVKVEKRFLLCVFLVEEWVRFFVSWFNRGKTRYTKFHKNSSVGESEKYETKLSDLPELALDCILERLSAGELCSMAGVCSWLRDKCVSDHLWAKHFDTKWGRLIGGVALKEWQRRISARKRHQTVGDQTKSLMWQWSWTKPELQGRRRPATRRLPVDSLMALYLSLEKGQFWFPAQVYNRENGHPGFMLSCYDAQLRYDSHKDTFQARYSPYGRQMIEESIKWDRIRAPPVDTQPHQVHVSQYLDELKPGDHIEIQWRQSTQFPFGWWYAVVGHTESCNGDEHRCDCGSSDEVVVEFKQFGEGSRWRKTEVKRKEHIEQGNEADGYYGGIRRLHDPQDIAAWMHLWPNQLFP